MRMTSDDIAIKALPDAVAPTPANVQIGSTDSSQGSERGQSVGNGDSSVPENQKTASSTPSPQSSASSSITTTNGLAVKDETQILVNDQLMLQDCPPSPMDIDTKEDNGASTLPGQPSSSVPTSEPESVPELELEPAATPALNAVPLPDETDLKWNMKMSWSGKVYDMSIWGNDLVLDFRSLIHLNTAVPPERQKLIGLMKGKLDPELDSHRFSSLGIKYPGPDGLLKFTMVGTPIADTFQEQERKKKPQKYDAFDLQYPERARAGLLLPADDPRNQRMVQDVVRRVPITIMNEPRPGKGLLVLDLDYTLVDTKPLLEGSLPPAECARPHMHKFLEFVYPHYDIVIWSQTHWRWLESKLVELGIIGGGSNYKICFVSDRTTMFPIFSKRDNKMFQHEVKPLQYFWASFPQWSAKNTIHIDDLSRNFALNPGEGLKIRAFKDAYGSQPKEDDALVYLGPYLRHLAENIPDFQTVDHGKWMETAAHLVEHRAINAAPPPTATVRVPGQIQSTQDPRDMNGLTSSSSPAANGCRTGHSATTSSLDQVDHTSGSASDPTITTDATASVTSSSGQPKSQSLDADQPTSSSVRIIDTDPDINMTTDSATVDGSQQTHNSLTSASPRPLAASGSPTTSKDRSDNQQ